MTETPAAPALWRAPDGDLAQEAVARIVGASKLDGAEIVFVVPPFASPDWPALGVHLLARMAETRGVKTAVLYGNLALARMIGPRLYRQLCMTRTEELIGERLFGPAHRGLIHDGPEPTPACWSELFVGDPPTIEDAQGAATLWAQAMADALASTSARMVGFTSSFEQTTSSLSVIRRLKQLRPDILTLLGGANADDEMGAGLADYEPALDFVFQGEAEASFTGFLDEYAQGTPDARLRVRPGEVLENLDSIPTPRFETFFRQFHATISEEALEDGVDGTELRIPYETSRGCWWGEKHHCTFCGLNANGMTHRIKSAERVAKDVAHLSARHRVRQFIMVDNIMPHSYFSTLLPALRKAENTLSIFYEQKANLTLKKMCELKEAGIDSIQPGIEALSNGLLRLMRKGSTVRTNLDCLRFARSAGVKAVWNLLVDFPNDMEEDYKNTISVLEQIFHLQPPTGMGGLSIDRFSPYHMTPDEFGLTKVRPLDIYDRVFPGGDLNRIAYHFKADYPSAFRRNPALPARIDALVNDWIEAWQAKTSPMLTVFAVDNGAYLVIDTRPGSKDGVSIVDERTAAILLNGANTLEPEAKQLLDRGQLVAVDGKYLAIACAAPDNPAWTRPVRIDAPELAASPP